MDHTSGFQGFGAGFDGDGLRLVRETTPFLDEDDEQGLALYARLHWPRQTLRPLLQHPHAETARVAAMCLGLIGTFADTCVLSRALHSDSFFVVTAAERAMWSIWMRASNEKCRTLLRQAVSAIDASDYAEAEADLDRILLDDPDFAEASNQRALLHYLTERYESSIMACRRTLALNPYHFGAAAGLGHNEFQRRQYAAALHAYRRALSLHPRMAGIRQAMRRTREAALLQPEPPTGNQGSPTIVTFPDDPTETR